MAKREYVGVYYVQYDIYYPWSDSYAAYTQPIGKCLGVEDAIYKAIAFVQNLSESGDKVKLRAIVDGWGNVYDA